MQPEDTSTRHRNFRQNNLQFVFFATVLLLLFGWSSVTRVLPINMDLSLAPISPAASRFVGLWIRMAMAVGILIPVLVILFFVRRSDVRTALGVYLFVLVFQIATEVSLSYLFFTSMAVPIGTVYTAFRLWQLWEAMKIIQRSDQLAATSRRIVVGLLMVLFGFWLINLIVVLIIIEWPRLFVA